MIAWCPRWTPSKTPIVTTERPQPPGAASYPRHRCMATSRPCACAAGGASTISGRARPSRSLTTATSDAVRREHARTGRRCRPGPADPPCESTFASSRRRVAGGQEAPRGVGHRQADHVGGAVRELRPASTPRRGEAADRRAAQRGQVAADAERGAQVAGHRPDVGAGRARRRPRRGRRRRRAGAIASTSSRDTVTGRGAQRDLLAGADPLVRPLPVDLDRADRARHLVDLAGQRREPGARSPSSVTRRPRTSSRRPRPRRRR